MLTRNRVLWAALTFGPFLPCSISEAQEPFAKPATSQPLPDKREPLVRFAGHTADIYTVVFCPDGKRVASASNLDVRVWDVTTGKEQFVYLTKGTNVFGLAFNPDGKRLAVGVSKQLRILDASTGQLTQTIVHPTHFLFRIAFSPDGAHLVTAGGSPSNTGDVRIWDGNTGREILQFKGHKLAVLNAVYSSDGQRVASSSGGTIQAKPGEIKVWEAKTGKEIQTLSGHVDNVYGVCLSPDGKYVASCSGVRGAARPGAVKVWEVASGKELFNLEGHTGPVFTVVYSPDGKRLATSSGDKTVRIWDVATGQTVLTLPAHGGVVYSLAFSPSGKRLVTAGQDKQVRVWDVGLGVPEGRVETLTAQQLDVLWTELCGADAAKAYRSLWTLAAAPKQTVPYLNNRVHPAAGLTVAQEKQAAYWLLDLDDAEFNVREQAATQLAGLGEGVLPALRQTLKNPRSPEVRRHVKELIETLTNAPLSSEQYGRLRAVDVLENIDTPEARDVLKKLADGLPEARLTQEAKQSLDRLARQSRP